MDNYYIAHHGIKGQKWGVRRYQNEDGTLTEAGKKRYNDGRGGLKSSGYRVMSKIYGMNERVYAKSNKTLSSMNKAAKEDMLKKAAEASANEARQREARAKEKLEQKDYKNRLESIDPELAKNKETRRVAYDYHNLSDLAFAGKYQTTKGAFARRYVRSDADTYSLGKKKAAIAAFINATVSRDNPVSAKTITKGSAAAAEMLAVDLAYSKAATSIGFDRAEKRYYQTKE